MYQDMTFFEMVVELVKAFFEFFKDIFTDFGIIGGEESESADA